MCLYLLIPEARRLTNVFLLNRRAEPVPQVPLLDTSWNRVLQVFPVLFGAYVLLVAGQQSVVDVKQMTATIQGPIRGIWAVEEVVTDGALEMPRRGDPSQWQDLVFDGPKALTIQTMDGKQTHYYMQLDEAQRSMKLWNVDDLNWRGALQVEKQQADRMTLEGQFGAHQVTAKLTRVDLSDPERFHLVNRGFHWVNDFVNNR